jgi:hypothetical protein
MLYSLSRKNRPLAVLALFVLILGGISAVLLQKSTPSQELVELEIKSQVERSIHGNGVFVLQSVRTLDGWSDGVELEVTFSIVATGDSTVRGGLLNGLDLRKGKELHGGKIAATYQWNSAMDKWELIRIGDVTLPK